MTSPIKSEILEQMGTLPEELQIQVLEFVKMLRSKPTKGVPGKDLLEFAGTIPLEDLEVMEKAIEEGCEQVNLDEW